MPQPTVCAHLTVEAPHRSWILGSPAWQELNGHDPFQRFVHGLEYGPHAANTDQADKSVVADSEPFRVRSFRTPATRLGRRSVGRRLLLGGVIR